MKSQKGSVHIIITGLIVLLLGALGFIFWQNFIQSDANTKQTSATNTMQTNQNTSKQEPKQQVNKTSIYPTLNDGSSSKESFAVTLPAGWSVQNVYEPYDIVKTIGDDKYLVSSFIEEDTNRRLMEQRIAEGIEVVAQVKTSAGTNVNVLKTPTELFLASCIPSGENCYLNFKEKKLYVHLYQVVPGAQSAQPIDYSSDSAKQMLSDFKNIAGSLNI